MDEIKKIFEKLYTQMILFGHKNKYPKKSGYLMPKTYQEEMNEIIDNMIKLLKQAKEIINKAEKESTIKASIPKK